MIKSSVTISLANKLSGGPWIYWGPLETSIPKAKKLGFDAVELFTLSASQVDSGKLSMLLEENQMKLCAVGTGAGKVLHGLTLTDPDKMVRSQAKAFIAEMIEFGAIFGAPAIIGSMQGRTTEKVSRQQALGWLGEGLIELAERAAAKRVRLIYEPLNRYETDMMNRLEDAAEFLASLRCDNVVLLADLFHMNIEEVSIEDSLRQHAAYIGHVHLADSNRRPAGCGHLDMTEVAKVLSETGFDGYLSAEALPYPNSDDAAQQTIAVINRYFIQK